MGKGLKHLCLGFLVAGTTLGLSQVAIAAPPTTLPGPADAARIGNETPLQSGPREDNNSISIPNVMPNMNVPAGAKQMHLVIKDVHIEGATAFTPEELKQVYAKYLNKDVTLDTAWVIAEEITKKYRENGYFLSRAYVPAQTLKGNILLINVVEGYIGEVEVSDPSANNYVLQRYINSLKKERPSKISTVESFLLRANDLPGSSFRAILSQIDEKNQNDAAIKLTLTPVDSHGKGSISFDNYGSRFLGPEEATATYSASLIPLNETSLSVLASTPTHELKYYNLQHDFVFAPDFTLEFRGGITDAHPGYNLKQYDIESDSKSFGLDLKYQWIRQRDENLGLQFALDARNTDSTILETKLTRDHVRKASVTANYDTSDSWYGYNVVNFAVTQGIDGLGSSEAGDLNLSRSQAKPDFRKAELSLTRLQGISDDWSILAAASGQLASGPLYSSEEFGYGGQNFGRAYDFSELTGDDGVAASLELRYQGWQKLEPIGLMPYIFYDTGKIWNEDIAQIAQDSASSTGLGLRFNTIWEISGNIGIALPISHKITTPIYGYDNSKNPRILFQISKQF